MISQNADPFQNNMRPVVFHLLKVYEYILCIRAPACMAFLCSNLINFFRAYDRRTLCCLQLCGNIIYMQAAAGSRSAIVSATDLRTRGPEFDTRSDNILSLFLPLIQDGHLSVTGKVCARSTG